jgi:hypothetical protein
MGRAFRSRSDMYRPRVSQAASPIRAWAGQGRRKGPLLGPLESFDIDAVKKAQLCICEPPSVQTATATLRKVAGMDVVSLDGLLFSRSKRASSSCWRFADLPPCSAAANAFIVGG